MCFLSTRTSFCPLIEIRKAGVMILLCTIQQLNTYFSFKIGGPSKMTFGTSNLLVFFLVNGYMFIKGVLDSTRPGLHNGLIKIRKN